MTYYTRVVFKHPNEKPLYLAGDTVWYEGVQEVIVIHKREGGASDQAAKLTVHV